MTSADSQEQPAFYISYQPEDFPDERSAAEHFARHWTKRLEDDLGITMSDEELSEHVGSLIRDPETRRKMGEHSTEMARDWDWDRIAPQWENLVIRLATSSKT